MLSVSIDVAERGYGSNVVKRLSGVSPKTCVSTNGLTAKKQKSTL